MSACPVNHGKASVSPDHANESNDAPDAAAGLECPVNHGSSPLPPNMMPPVSQTPSPGQRVPLSIEREKSSIPTADGKNVWMYPSEQMFYNALNRKNYNAVERDMHDVVRIHNAVNERSWSEILKWERTLHPECSQQKLVRFEGLPGQPSIRARMLGFLGYVPPFDRHDWVIDRCGTEVRYVIDFYHGKSRDSGKPASFYLDVRPAVTIPGVVDRFRMAAQSFMSSQSKNS